MDQFEKYVGCVFDSRYKIERIIGVGGMAVVYKAFDLLMRRTVAVKVLKDEIASDVPSVKRFINESKAVAMLSHPNIVNIYDVSVRDNAKYIVMEYIEGVTLKNYMTRKGRLSYREVISYAEQILHALEHAHSKGIVHRDIKPQNIMILQNGIIKVMDFGIAKLPNAETVTMEDKAIGTVFYISPEQVTGKKIDARSDLYSLGVMLYEMATGKLPFNSDSTVAIAMMQVSDEPAPPRSIDPEIPVGLEQIIMTAMEKDPADRFANASEMLRCVTKLRENPKTVFRRPADKEKRAEKEKKQEDKPARRRRATFLPIILGVTTAFLLVAGISGYYILSTLLFNESLDTSEKKTIPKFVGSMWTSELAEWFKNSDYYTVELAYEPSDAPAGEIIDQNPKEGETRKATAKKSKINVILTISKGAETIEMPDVTVLEYRAVQQQLRALGLNPKVERETSDAYDEGYIIRTDPVAGTICSPGDTVTLYVSAGTDIKRVSVPQFVGMTEQEAMRELIESKLLPGDVEYVKSSKPKGQVLEQSVIAFTEAEQWSKIDFTVSGGPDGVQPGEEQSTEAYVPVTEPPVTGPPVTKAPVTEAPVTEPPATEPPETETDADTAEESTVSVESESDASGVVVG
jgi:serine/threonine protein kinase